MILFLVGLLSITVVSAEIENLGTFKQYDCIELFQSCSNCSFSNLTSVTYPNGTKDPINILMTKSGLEYNYTYCKTTTLGDYIINGFSDADGENTVWAYNMSISPSGTNNLSFYIIILCISGVVIIFGFFIKDAWITILGTFGLYFVGLYTLINGIAGIRNTTYTMAISIILLGLAGYISINSALEVIEDYT